MIPFPEISPDVFAITIAGREFALRWYALAYLAGLLIGWRIIVALMRRPRLWGGAAPMRPEQVEELLTWVVVGVILGGRLGFVLFYEPGYYLSHPAEILRVWQGGMSFHGGFLGVVLAAWVWARRNGIAALRLLPIFGEPVDQHDLILVGTGDEQLAAAKSVERGQQRERALRIRRRVQLTLRLRTTVLALSASARDERPTAARCRCARGRLVGP